MTGSGESTLVTARSAWALAVVVAVARLLAVLASAVPPATWAVLVRVVPAATPPLTRTTRVKIAVSPAATVARVLLTVPVPPTGGVALDQPAGDVKDTNVVLAGTVSVRLTFWASLGPVLVTLTV